MTKFRIVKKFSLDFISPEWKDAYINFNALTANDAQKTLPQLAKMKDNEKDEVETNVGSILNLLKEKFVDGKGVSENGELIDLKGEDLGELPISVLSKASVFLFQDATTNSQKQ